MKKTILKNPSHKNVRTMFVSGTRGCGKSTFVKDILRGKKDKRVIIFDPTREYHFEEGYPLLTTIDGLINYVKKHYRTGFVVCYRPAKMTTSQRRKSLDNLAKLLMKIQQPFYDMQSTAKMTLVVEEMGKAYPNRNLEKEMPHFEEFITEGRHYGISLIGINQSAVKVNTNFRDNLTEEVLFKQSRRMLAELGRAIESKEDAKKAVMQEPHHYILLKDNDVIHGKNPIQQKN